MSGSETPIAANTSSRMAHSPSPRPRSTMTIAISARGTMLTPIPIAVRRPATSHAGRRWPIPFPTTAAARNMVNER